MTEQRLGRIYVDGKPYGNDKPYPIQQNIIKGLICSGINEERIQLHKPVYPGFAKCKKCFQSTFKPLLKVYQGSEYWICRCQQINYIKN